MKYRVLKMITIVILLIMCFTPYLLSQDIKANLYKYISSNKSILSGYVNVKKMKEEFPEYYNEINSNLSIMSGNVQEYYQDLLENGIDLFDITDEIFFSVEPPEEGQELDFDFENSEFMIAFSGRFSYNLFSKYFAKYDDFAETKTQNARIFNNESEDTSIIIIMEQLLVIVPINKSVVVTSRLVSGFGLTKGNLSSYIDVAREKYDLIYMVIDMESYGPVNITDLKEAGDYVPSVVDLPDEMTFKSSAFGIYSDGKEGFNMEFNMEGINANDVKILSNVANQSLSMVKALIPVLIGSTFSEGEDAYDEEDSGDSVEDIVDDTPVLSDEQQMELTKFIHAITLNQEGNYIILIINFPKTVLDILEELMKNYNF